MEESHFSSRENFSYFSCEKERKRVTFPVERKNIATFPELKKSLFQWKERTGPLFLTSYVYQQNGSSIIFLTPGKVRGLQLFFFLLSAKRGATSPGKRGATSPGKRGPLLPPKEGHFSWQKRVTSSGKRGSLRQAK